ncbi:cation:proton antiporter [Corallincola platygyrae]|uniref:Cation:proton antiporter n=1 Tax=Corallincola platygyrae TaxID=1193278 RepID=A0ABW4XPW3_9GAMM
MALTAELLLLLCAIFALVIGSAIRQLLHGRSLPYTVALLLVGLALGALDRSGLLIQVDPVSNQLVTYIATMEPHLILALFLPILVFESAFNMEPHLFKRLFPQISLLAVPGLLITTLLTAWACKSLLPWEWSWPEALLFGALISATDPVAVVALLKEIGARKRLETLLEGESLLNDGTAIVLFLLFLGLLQPGATIGGDTLIRFVVVAAGGALVGYLFGRLFLVWIRNLSSDHLSQISLSVASAFFCYMFAELILHVSGVVAVVTLGLTLTSQIALWLPSKVLRFLNQFWHLLAHVANTLAFLLVGITIAVNIPLGDTLSWGLIPWVYLLVMGIRAVTVFLLYPFLKMLPGGFRLDKALVMVWGSLRGAVALVLALSLVHVPELATERGHQILFLTAGVVSLTLLINAATMRSLCKWLKLDQLPPAKQAAMDHASSLLNQSVADGAKALKQDPLFALSNWPRIEQQLGLDDQTAPAQQPDLDALFRQLLEAERQFYWQQYHQGYLSRASLHQMLKALDLALDGCPKLDHYADIANMIKPGLWMKWRHRLPGGEGRQFKQEQRYVERQYEIGLSFLRAQTALEELLDQLSLPDTLSEPAKHALHENSRQWKIKLEAMAQHYPALCRAVQTRIANRVLLEKRSEAIDKLASQGLLESGERTKLQQDNRQRRRASEQSAKWSQQENVLAQLQQLNTTSSWPIEHLQSLVRNGKHKLIAEGELIFPEPHSHHWLLLLAGTVQVFDRQAGLVTDVTLKQAGVQLGVDPTGKAECSKGLKAICPVEVLLLDRTAWSAISKEFSALPAKLLQLPK